MLRWRNAGRQVHPDIACIAPMRLLISYSRLLNQAFNGVQGSVPGGLGIEGSALQTLASGVQQGIVGTRVPQIDKIDT